MITIKSAREYPYSAGYRKDEFSKEAAQKVNLTLRPRQEEVLNALGNDSNPLSSEEIALRVGRPALSVKPRLSELKEMGLVRKVGRGRTELGGTCNKWELV